MRRTTKTLATASVVGLLTMSVAQADWISQALWDWVINTGYPLIKSNEARIDELEARPTHAHQLIEDANGKEVGYLTGQTVQFDTAQGLFYAGLKPDGSGFADPVYTFGVYARPDCSDPGFSLYEWNFFGANNIFSTGYGQIIDNKIYTVRTEKTYLSMNELEIVQDNGDSVFINTYGYQTYGDGQCLPLSGGPIARLPVVNGLVEVWGSVAGDYVADIDTYTPPFKVVIKQY